MSQIAFCPKGGQSGILLTRKELGDMATRLGRKSIDEVIPLPGLSFEDQKTRLQSRPLCKHDDTGQHYWEVEGTGEHGWCCNFCGEVTQWG